MTEHSQRSLFNRRSVLKYMASVAAAYRDLLCRLRSERAGELMRDTKYSNLEISSQLGYSSPSHFARAFKNFAAMTPTAYRKSLSKGPKLNWLSWE